MIARVSLPAHTSTIIGMRRLCKIDPDWHGHLVAGRVSALKVWVSTLTQFLPHGPRSNDPTRHAQATCWRLRRPHAALVGPSSAGGRVALDRFPFVTTRHPGWAGTAGRAGPCRTGTCGRDRHGMVPVGVGVCVGIAADAELVIVGVGVTVTACVPDVVGVCRS
jgi:hypothetical protein